jgi:hypothetical protein
MRREIEVFGKRLLVERSAATWSVFEPSVDGKRRPAPGLLVPAFVVTEADLEQYLADVLHERATPTNRSIRWLD